MHTLFTQVQITLVTVNISLLNYRKMVNSGVHASLEFHKEKLHSDKETTQVLSQGHTNDRTFQLLCRCFNKRFSEFAMNNSKTDQLVFSSEMFYIVLGQI